MDAKKRCLERRQLEQSSRKNSKTTDHLVLWIISMSNCDIFITINLGTIFSEWKWGVFTRWKVRMCYGMKSEDWFQDEKWGFFHGMKSEDFLLSERKVRIFYKMKSEMCSNSVPGEFFFIRLGRNILLRRRRSKSTSLFIKVDSIIIPNLSTWFSTSILTTWFESCIPIRSNDAIIESSSIYVPNCIACWVSVMVSVIMKRMKHIIDFFLMNSVLNRIKYEVE